jgi:hypothetical protein
MPARDRSRSWSSTTWKGRPRIRPTPAPVEGGRAFWWALLAAIVSAGLLSRAAHTGFRLFDKFLGDALYAAMVYVLFRLTGRIARVTLWAAVSMTAIEFFQLTQIPAGMLRSASPAVRILARLLGTEFSVLDLLAYAVGIASVAAVDRLWNVSPRMTARSGSDFRAGPER